MSANTVVDLRATTDYPGSLVLGSGSNLIIGRFVDLLNADTYCNVWVAGGANSGIIEVRIQTSDGTTSGSFTDPTSGLPASARPTWLASGGVMFVNSGLHVSGNQSLSAPVVSMPIFASGGIQFGAFQRPHRYARLINNSGGFTAPILAGFVSQKCTTSSGGGFTYNPGSGSVNV